LEIRAKIAKASLWLSGARLASNGLSAFSIAVLTIYLNPDMYGVVFTAMAIMVIVTAITEISLSESLIAVQDPTPDYYDTAWTLGLIRGLFLAATLWSLAPVTAWIYRDPRLTAVVCFVALIPFLASIKSPMIAGMERNLKFHQNFFIDVGTSLSTVGLSVFLAYEFGNYWAVISGAIFGQVVGTVLSFVVAPYTPKLTISKWRQLVGFSVWISFGQAFCALNYRLDQLLVGGYLGSSALGIYAVGGRIAQLPGREATRPLTATLYPAYSVAAGDNARLRSMYSRSQTMVTAIALPLTVVVGVLADTLVRHIMSPGWTQAIVVIQVMAAVTALESLGSLVYPLAMAMNKTRVLVVRDAQKFAMRAPLILFGMLAGGLVGLIIARAVAAIIGVVIDMQLVKSLLNLPLVRQMQDNSRTLLSTIIMAVGMLVLKWLTPEPGDAVAAGFWLVAMVLIGVVINMGSRLLLWLLSDMSSGPENDALIMMKAVVSRFVRARAAE